MTMVYASAQLMRHQCRNLHRIVKGVPVQTPQFVSQTLEYDDVHLARKLLGDNELRHDESNVQYDEKFARWNGSKYAFSFMSGRESLSACISALGLTAGDEVILPAYTCVVVANAFKFAGVGVVYSDIELETYGLDAGQVEKRISPRTKAIVIQHLYGLVCRDYDHLIELSQSFGLRVIEDCAHSTGASYNGVKVGNRGQAAFYSTERSKVITTIAGGMAVTNDESVAARLREFHERAPYPDDAWIKRQLINVLLDFYQYKHSHRWLMADIMEFALGGKRIISTTRAEEQGRMPPSYGRKMPSAIAALGLNQLLKIDRFNNRRREASAKWDHWCTRRGYGKPLVIRGSLPVFLRYPVLVEQEKKSHSGWSLKELGVEVGSWFVSQLHPVRVALEGFPNSSIAVRQCINLPTLM